MSDAMFTIILVVLAPVAWVLLLFFAVGVSVVTSRLAYEFRVRRVYWNYRRGL